MAKMDDELRQLRAMPIEALAAEAYVLRERLRYMRQYAEAAIARAKAGDPLSIGVAIEHFALPCDLLPESPEPRG